MNLVWRKLTPGTGGLCVPELAQVGQFSRSDLHGCLQGWLQPCRANITQDRRRKLAHVFSLVLRMLLRKAMQFTCRVENKNPDCFQTFDPIAFSGCFFMLRTLDSLGFFPLKIFLRDKERIRIWLHTKCKMSSGVHFENSCRLPAQTLFSLPYWAFVFQCYASCSSSRHNMGQRSEIFGDVPFGAMVEAIC